jgi:hypothetical protein
LATSSSADGPATLHSTLDHLAKHRLDVCLRKRSQRLRPNISKGAAAQSKRSHGNIIRCLDYRDDIDSPSVQNTSFTVAPHFFAMS